MVIGQTYYQRAYLKQKDNHYAPVRMNSNIDKLNKHNQLKKKNQTNQTK